MWSFSHCSWIYNYLCNQCLSSLMLWVQTPLMVRCTRYNIDKVCQWLTTGRWFSPGTPVSSTNKTNLHDVTEILLKVTFNTTIPPSINYACHTCTIMWEILFTLLPSCLTIVKSCIVLTLILLCTSSSDIFPASINIWTADLISPFLAVHTALLNCI